MDLPYAQARWHTAENVGHQSLSAHKSEQFGQDYGVLIKEWRLLQRAVFVIDRDGTVLYAEYVPDQMQEPDYGKAVAAARAAVACPRVPAAKAKEPPGGAAPLVGFNTKTPQHGGISVVSVISGVIRAGGPSRLYPVGKSTTKHVPPDGGNSARNCPWCNWTICRLI
jgi:hypothetical protein